MMKPLYLTITQRLRVRLTQWRSTVVAGLLGGWAVVAMVACGGGGGSVAAVGSGGTGTVGTVNTFNIGTVTGFGSIFVNGVRFDDTGASVSDEDGARRLSDVRLGMVVQVLGSVNASGSATASHFTFDSELLGPVRSISAASKTLVILGQSVAVDANTVFDASLPSGFASLQTTQVIEVHGYLDANTNALQATFVELKSNPNRYKLSGIVRNLQSASKTFQIGQETVTFSSVATTDIATNFANGQLIKVRLAPSAPNTQGQWQAGRLRSGSRNPPNNNDRVDIEGLVSAVVSTTQFSVSGVQIDASNASFTNGSAGLVAGARVKVKGTLVAGTLAAVEVKLKQSGASGGSSGDSGSGTSDMTDIEIRGLVSDVNTTAKTFVVRGVVVNFAGTVLYENGTQATLSNGANVQVTGQTAVASSQVQATRIRFDN